jgi:hypothetical protein
MRRELEDGVLWVVVWCISGDGLKSAVCGDERAGVWYRVAGVRVGGCWHAGKNFAWTKGQG